jgi:predicted nuclease of restriction endonuclease-like RecB superfamily
MLPIRLLAYSLRGRELVPHYLAQRDEPWVREVLGELDGLTGKTVSEAEDVFARVSESSQLAHVPSRTLKGVWHVGSRLWAPECRAAASPPRVRDVVFTRSARGGARADVIEAAAHELGIAPSAVLEALFADRSEWRRIRSPRQVPSPTEFVQHYNLALLQGLLLHSTEVVVHARSQVRSVVRFARLKRLLCTYDSTEGGLKLALSGPLSVLRNTKKYGHALATFVPAAMATPGWSIVATCVLGGHEAWLVADGRTPIAAPFCLPREVDSAVERHVLRDVRRRGSAWAIHRETEAVMAGQKVFFPDFTLTRGASRVLVEIVGWWTPEYLTAKLKALRDAALDRIIVCVDGSLGCDPEAITASEVLVYRKRVDAAALLEAAERVSAARG